VSSAGPTESGQERADTFRTELRRWFAANPPPARAGGGDGTEDDYDGAAVLRQRHWQRRLSRAGLAGIAWPEEYGGRGASPMQQLIFHEEHQRAGGGGNELFFVGLGHAGPTLIEWGTEAQRRRWLPGILDGDLIFAQCFSEPGAGSDLAAIATSAVPDGGDLVVTGQKMWSTYAQYADLCELLVRTDTDDRYGGLTYLIADLRAPGVTVRPIRSITGRAEFCEVFFDGVRIPVDNVVGTLGQGWQVATTTLTFERSTAFAATVIGLGAVVAELGERCSGDPVESRCVAELADDVHAARALLYHCVAEQQRGRAAEAAGALKLVATELNQRVRRYAALHDAGPVLDYLSSFGLCIGGGTSEIQRNIIAERILRLPRDPR